MLNITSEIKSIGYDGDNIRTFTFTAKVTHSDYPNVSTSFGGEPLVNLPRGTDLQEYVQVQFTHDQAFVAHMTNALEFEYIKAGLTVESVPLSPEELRAQMAPLPARKFWKAAGLIGITEDGLASAFANPEDPAYIADDTARNDAIIDLRKTAEFERLYPLLVQASAAAGIPADQLDALWAWTHSQP